MSSEFVLQPKELNQCQAMQLGFSTRFSQFVTGINLFVAGASMNDWHGYRCMFCVHLYIKVDGTRTPCRNNSIVKGNDC